MNHKLLPAAVALLVLLVAVCDAQTLRIASYNMAGKPNKASDQTLLESVVGAMGNKQVWGTAQPVDLMAFQEGPADVADYVFLEQAMENVFGTDFSVVYSELDASNTRTGFVYNAERLALLESYNLGGIGWGDRNQLLVRFSLIGGSADDNFYIYSCHFTEGDTIADEDSRHTQAILWNDTINQLGLFGQNYITVGTFGINHNREIVYQFLNGFDTYDTLPYDTGTFEAVWVDNEAYVPFHGSEPTGLISGMITRPDFFSNSYWLSDQMGMEYVEGSATTMGNNGTHMRGSGISTGNGDLAVQSALAMYSDQLPVFCDYRFNVVDHPSNDLYVGFATENFTVQPAGPRQGAGGSAFFNIEGDGNGQFASFGVLDFDLTTELNDLEEIYNTERVEIFLSQSNASFTENGPYQIYLCSPAATAVPIDSSIQYVVGNNGIDCVPAILSAGARLVATYPGIHRYPDGSLYPYSSGVIVRLTGPDIGPAFTDATQNNGNIRLLFVPMTDTTACTFAGVAHTGSAWPPRNVNWADIKAVFNGDTMNLTRGIVWSGSLADTHSSDNDKLTLRTNDFIEFTVRGNTRSWPLRYLRLKFEASSRSSRPVQQKVEFFNFDTQQYEVVHVGTTSSLGDRVEIIDATGDLGRFVDDGTRDVLCRISFTKVGLSRGIQAFIDHIEWSVR